MPALVLVWSLLVATPACTGGSTDEVPLVFEGRWSDSEKQWLEDEFSNWFVTRERRVCRLTDASVVQKLVLGRTADQADSTDTVTISFFVESEERTRSVNFAGEAEELRRYSVAATTEELVRATWAELAPKRFGFGISPHWRLLLARDSFLGGSLVFSFSPSPKWSFSASLGFSQLLARELDDSSTLSASLPWAKLEAAWLGLGNNRFRCGPALSAESGPFFVNLTPTPLSPRAQFWLAGSAGLVAHVLFKFFRLHAEVSGGMALSGASLTREGRSTALLFGPIISTEIGMSILF